MFCSGLAAQTMFGLLLDWDYNSQTLLNHKHLDLSRHFSCWQRRSYMTQLACRLHCVLQTDTRRSRDRACTLLGVPDQCVTEGRIELYRPQRMARRQFTNFFILIPSTVCLADGAWSCAEHRFTDLTVTEIVTFASTQNCRDCLADVPSDNTVDFVKGKYNETS